MQDMILLLVSYRDDEKFNIKEKKENHEHYNCFIDYESFKTDVSEINFQEKVINSNSKAYDNPVIVKKKNYNLVYEEILLQN